MIFLLEWESNRPLAIRDEMCGCCCWRCRHVAVINISWKRRNFRGTQTGFFVSPWTGQERAKCSDRERLITRNASLICERFNGHKRAPIMWENCLRFFITAEAECATFVAMQWLRSSQCYEKPLSSCLQHCIEGRLRTQKWQFSKFQTRKLLIWWKAAQRSWQLREPVSEFHA